MKKAKPDTPANWRVEVHDSGRVTVWDATGQVRGRFRDVMTLAAHFAMLMQELDTLRAREKTAMQAINDTLAKNALPVATTAWFDNGNRYRWGIFDRQTDEVLFQAETWQKLRVAVQRRVNRTGKPFRFVWENDNTVENVCPKTRKPAARSTASRARKAGPARPAGRSTD